MKHQKIYQISIIIIISIMVYGFFLNNGFIWDDDLYVYNNPFVKSMDGLKTIWFSRETSQYYPLTYTSFWIEHKFWVLNPFGYHVVNLILHICNSLMIFLILRNLYKRAAFPVALIFAVHPIQVETVAWISERKNLLGFIFFLAALLVYLKFDGTKKTRYYLMAIGFFVCALLSKSVSVCFVCVPILYKWYKDGKVTWREVKISIPFVIIGLTAAINTIYIEANLAGAKGDAWDLTILEKFVLSGRILLFYIYKLCVPFEFMSFYPRWNVDTSVWWQWTFSIVSLFLLFSLVCYRNKIGRGPATLFIFYIISIFPALGFVNVYPMLFSFVADHFSYFSAPAILLLICATVILVLDKVDKKVPLLWTNIVKILKWSVLSIVIIFLCSKSMALNHSYKNLFTFWEEVIRKNPKAWIGHHNLAVLYMNIGELERSESFYEKAIEIRPDYARAYYNLALLYVSSGKQQQAIVSYKKAIEIVPYHVSALNNLGTIYSDMNKYTEAIKFYTKAIEFGPDYLIAHRNLAVAYYNQKKYDLAIKHYDKAIKLGFKSDSLYLEILEQYRKQD